MYRQFTKSATTGTLQTAQQADYKCDNSMRYFLDNYLTYIPVCLFQVKVFEAAYEALRVVAEREKQRRHHIT